MLTTEHSSVIFLECSETVPLTHCWYQTKAANGSDTCFTALSCLPGSKHLCTIGCFSGIWAAPQNPFHGILELEEVLLAYGYRDWGSEQLSGCSVSHSWVLAQTKFPSPVPCLSVSPRHLLSASPLVRGPLHFLLYAWMLSHWGRGT